MRWLDGITDTMGMNLGKLWEMVRENSGRPGVLRSMGSPRAGHDLVTHTSILSFKLIKPYLFKIGGFSNYFWHSLFSCIYVFIT